MIEWISPLDSSTQSTLLTQEFQMDNQSSFSKRQGDFLLQKIQFTLHSFPIMILANSQKRRMNSQKATHSTLNRLFIAASSQANYEWLSKAPHKYYQPRHCIVYFHIGFREKCKPRELIRGMQSHKNSTPLRIHTRRRSVPYLKSGNKSFSGEPARLSLGHPVSSRLFRSSQPPLAAFPAQRGRCMEAASTVFARILQRNNGTEIKKRHREIVARRVGPRSFQG